jgi:hypothetical protein
VDDDTVAAVEAEVEEAGMEAEVEAAAAEAVALSSFFCNTSCNLARHKSAFSEEDIMVLFMPSESNRRPSSLTGLLGGVRRFDFDGV